MLARPKLRWSVSLKIWGKIAMLVVLLWLAWATALKPVFVGWQMEQELARRMAVGAANVGRQVTTKWHAEDPLSDAAWERENQLAFGSWYGSHDKADRKWLLESIEKGDRVRPSVAGRYRTYAQGFLLAFRRHGDQADLAQSIEFHKRVVELAPSEAIDQAQLAWVLAAADQVREAGEAASQALELDQLNPHDDRALRNRFVRDGAERYRQENAEQLMKRLRSQAKGSSAP